MRQLSPALIGVIILTFSGCLAGGWVNSSPNSETTTPNVTATTVGPAHDDITHELAITADDRPRTFAIKIKGTDRDTAVFNKTVSVEPGKTRTWDFSYPVPGNYTITAVLDNSQSRQITYHIETRNPPNAIEVAVSDDGELLVAKRF